MCARCWAGNHKKAPVYKGDGGRTVKSRWRSCRKCTNVPSRYLAPPRLEGKGHNSPSVPARSSEVIEAKGNVPFCCWLCRECSFILISSADPQESVDFLMFRFFECKASI